MAKWTMHVAALAALVSVNATACAAMLTAHELGPNDLVISEYLANPVGASDSQAEYFEIFNTTPFAIDMTDIVIRDDGDNAFTVSGLTIAAGSFAVFTNGDGVALELTPDYIYGSDMSLTNTGDEIGLFRPDDTQISKVAYTDGDFFGAGIAHELAVFSPLASALLHGPSSGTDFIAAVASLPLGNFGSPGFAGQTVIQMPAVPVPASIWMFGSALSMLAWLRRKATHRRGIRDAEQEWPGSPDRRCSRYLGNKFDGCFSGDVVCKRLGGGILQT